ncbi:hypothetical protein CT0861_09062, partial [Colletotrichum tofieldiae]
LPHNSNPRLTTPHNHALARYKTSSHTYPHNEKSQCLLRPAEAEPETWPGRPNRPKSPPRTSRHRPSRPLSLRQEEEGAATWPKTAIPMRPVFVRMLRLFLGVTAVAQLIMAGEEPMSSRVPPRKRPPPARPRPRARAPSTTSSPRSARARPPRTRATVLLPRASSGSTT